MDSNMSAQLIVGDIGSTKGAWTGVMSDGSLKDLLTEGFNPHAHPEEVLLSILKRVAATYGTVHQILYYGTGISDAVVVSEVRSCIEQVTDVGKVTVESDLVGAARACLGNSPGIVAILGTGSNACRYDGNSISTVTPSLGYPLGDEGSGWRIGSLMIRGYYYREMPEDLRVKFRDLLPDTRRELLTYLKRSSQPNRYLASFAAFASDNRKHPWISDTVSNCLDVFITSHLLPLAAGEPVYFAGGIAGSFNEILDYLLKKYGLTMGGVIADPLKRLVKYHIDS